MSHDVFISHSSKDKPIADAICANLESAGVRCWIAPRDIEPGDDWPTAIAKAIAASRLMVLVFSSSSNSSEDVGREIMLAANCKLVIIPFKIENIEPEPGKQYYLARMHWLDAMNPPTQEQITILVNRAKTFITSIKVDEKKEKASEPKTVLPPTPSPLPNQFPQKKRSRRLYLWIPAALIVLSLAAWAAISFIGRPNNLFAQSIPTSAPTVATLAFTPTLNLTAKVGMTGAAVFSGPGQNYPKIDFTFEDLTIIGQAYGCAWLEVTFDTGSGIEHGWVNADQVTYYIQCSDIPMDMTTGDAQTAPTTHQPPGQPVPSRARYRL